MRLGGPRDAAAYSHLPDLLALWKHVQPRVRSDQTICESYANGQTYGMSGEIHTDAGSEVGHQTVVYYANAHWQANWHGETFFYNRERNDVLRAVLPRPGRLVIFESDIPHAGRDPSRACPILRVTITFKLQRTPGLAVLR